MNDSLVSVEEFVKKSTLCLPNILKKINRKMKEKIQMNKKNWKNVDGGHKNVDSEIRALYNPPTTPNEEVTEFFQMLRT